jgi:hypothetical protein
VYGARPLKRYLQSAAETLIATLGYCRKIIFRVRRVLHVVCAVFIHHAQAVWRNAHHRVCRRRRIIPQTFLLFCHSIAAFHSYYARGSDLQPPKSVVYCKNLFSREAVQMDKKRDYIEFIGSMLIFGTNGLLVTNIPLTSAQIVLTRTFFGSIFLLAWCWPEVSFPSGSSRATSCPCSYPAYAWAQTGCFCSRHTNTPPSASAPWCITAGP